MSNYNDPLGGTAELAGKRDGRCFVMSHVHDAKSTEDGNLTNAVAKAMLNVPANTFVLAVFAEVVTAEGSAGNFDVGDGTDPEGWDVDVDVNSAAGQIMGNGAYAAQTAGGKLYTSADTIDITPSIDLDTAVIRVTAIMMPLPNGDKPRD